MSINVDPLRNLTLSFEVLPKESRIRGTLMTRGIDRPSHAIGYRKGDSPEEVAEAIHQLAAAMLMHTGAKPTGGRS